MVLAAFWSSGSREDLKVFLSYLGMAASWSQDNEVSEYDQKYYNYKLQTYPLHHEEKPLNIYSNKISVRQ